MPAATLNRKRTQVSISKPLYEWLESQIGPAKPYYNMSHAMDAAVASLKDDKLWLEDRARQQALIAELRGRVKALEGERYRD